MRGILVLLIVLGMAGGAQAATYYVETSGDDTAGDGAQGSPYRTIQKAVDVAAAGDTIEVGAGRYTKAGGARVVIDIENKSNLTIEGATGGGTIIDGSDHTITGGWTGPSEYGVYSISKPYSTYGQWDLVTVDAGNGPEVLVTGCADQTTWGGCTFNPEDKWYWLDAINKGISNPDQNNYYDEMDGYATLRGQAFHNATGADYSPHPCNDGNLYVKCVDDSGEPYNINDFTVKCSRKTMGDKLCGGMLLDNNADNITVRNLNFQNGYYQVLIYASNGALFDNCIFRAYKNCMKLFGDKTGSSGAGNVTVRYCELDVHPFALRSGYTGKHFEYGAEVWKAQKEWGEQDWWGIFMAGTKGGHHFHDNYIHDGWDGIGGGCANGDWKNTECDHNLIENMLDDPIDIYANCSNAKIHDNVSINSQQLTRIRGIDSDADAALYFYNNIMLRGPMTDQAFNFSSGVTGTGRAYFYHNTIEGTRTNVCTHDKSLNRGIFCNQNSDCSYDNWWWANNLFHGFQWTKNDPASIFEIDWQADYNVYCLNKGFSSWTYPGRIDTDFTPSRYIDQPAPDGHTVWSTSGPGYVQYDDTNVATRSYTKNYDVALTSDSPAIKAGTSDLNGLFGLSAGTLPGTLGTDCGALQRGASMPIVPRKAEK